MEKIIIWLIKTCKSLWIIFLFCRFFIKRFYYFEKILILFSAPLKSFLPLNLELIFYSIMQMMTSYWIDDLKIYLSQIFAFYFSYVILTLITLSNKQFIIFLKFNVCVQISCFYVIIWTFPQINDQNNYTLSVILVELWIHYMY
jgi:hypothetical protein